MRFIDRAVQWTLVHFQISFSLPKDEELLSSTEAKMVHTKETREYSFAQLTITLTTSNNHTRENTRFNALQNMYRTWTFLWNTIQVIIINVIGYSDTVKRCSGLPKKKKKAYKLSKIQMHKTLALDLKMIFQKSIYIYNFKFHTC